VISRLLFARRSDAEGNPTGLETAALEAATLSSLNRRCSIDELSKDPSPQTLVGWDEKGQRRSVKLSGNPSPDIRLEQTGQQVKIDLNFGADVKIDAVRLRSLHLGFERFGIQAGQKNHFVLTFGFDEDGENMSGVLHPGGWIVEINLGGQWYPAGSDSLINAGLVLRRVQDLSGLHSYELRPRPEAIYIVSSKQSAEEARPYLEAITHRVFPRVKPIILFESRIAGCHPYAIAKAMSMETDEFEIWWALSPGRSNFPSFTKPVLRGSPQWGNARRRASMIVTNSELMEYDNLPDSPVVQTWHGMPLKRIGLDVHQLSEEQLDWWSREVSHWTHLVSSSPDFRQLMESAFRFSSDVFEAGPARLDLLHTYLSSSRRTDGWRRRLNIGLHNRIVLFAPTWRLSEPPFLLLEALLSQLPSDVVVLFRGHSNRRSSFQTFFNARVRNVSDYPDVSPFLAIADVLVTDYSSIMFDFAHTGRPIICFAPDFEQYQESVGFYFDIESDLGLPLVSQVENLAREIVHQFKSPNKANSALKRLYGSHGAGIQSRDIARRLLKLVS